MESIRNGVPTSGVDGSSLQSITPLEHHSRSDQGKGICFPTLVQGYQHNNLHKQHLAPCSHNRFQLQRWRNFRISNTVKIIDFTYYFILKLDKSETYFLSNWQYLLNWSEYRVVALPAEPISIRKAQFEFVSWFRVCQRCNCSRRLYLLISSWIVSCTPQVTFECQCHLNDSDKSFECKIFSRRFLFFSSVLVIPRTKKLRK